MTSFLGPFRDRIFNRFLRSFLDPKIPLKKRSILILFTPPLTVSGLRGILVPPPRGYPPGGWYDPPHKSIPLYLCPAHHDIRVLTHLGTRMLKWGPDVRHRFLHIFRLLQNVLRAGSGTLFWGKTSPKMTSKRGSKWPLFLGRKTIKKRRFLDPPWSRIKKTFLRPKNRQFYRQKIMSFLSPSPSMDVRGGWTRGGPSPPLSLTFGEQNERVKNYTFMQDKPNIKN